MLRDYQNEARDSVWRYFQEGGKGNPIVAMPTATGKSFVIGDLVKSIMLEWPSQRLLMLTHVKELVAQNYEKLKILWPDAPCGIVSSGLRKREIGYPVTYASVGSVVRHTANLGKIDLIIIDECHLVSDKSASQYQKIIADLKKVNPPLKVIGFSATPFRMGLGLLTDGTIFDDICYDGCTRDKFNWFVKQGYLSPLIARPMDTALNVDDVKKSGGDYQAKSLQRAMDKEEVTEAACQEFIAVAADRQKGLIFSSGIDHAVHIYECLDRLGESAAFVHSKMGDAFGGRDKVLAAHKAGRFKWLVNADMLTTGYDSPAIDCIVMLRPTLSAALWVQMLGRGTRVTYAPGFDLSTQEGRLAAIAASEKQNCLVLDFARNTEKIGPVNDPILPRKKGAGGGEAPFKLCRDENTKEENGCKTYNHPKASICEKCGNTFIFETKITEQASTKKLIASSEPEYDFFDVISMTSQRHKKEGKQDSLKIGYHCGFRHFNIWIFPEHQGPPRKRSEKWWARHSQGKPMPKTIQQCLQKIETDITTPRKLKVWVNRQFPEIVEFYFDEK